MGKKLIFYIDSMQLGGAERVMSNLCNYFASKNDEVLLINDSRPLDGAKEYELDNRIKRLFLDTDGIRVIRNLKRILALRRIMKNENADIVISFLGPPNIRMLISSIGLNTKRLVSVRNDPRKEYGQGLRRIFANIIFLSTDGCVFQTQMAADYFWKPIQNKSVILYNMVKKDFFEGTCMGTEKSILMVGRLQEQKNPELLIKAFARIHNKLPGYVVEYYGEGELESNLKKIALQLGVSEKIKFKGKTQEIKEKLERARLYVMTSDYEGMPNSLMEAMAVGIPAISTDCPCGGPRMLITNETEGRLIPVNDDKKLSATIMEILENEDMWHSISVHEKKRAQAFLPEKVMDEWEKYINDVISSNHHR